MTHHQLGTMKYLIEKDVDLEAAEWLNLGTLGSLLKRGWVQRYGTKIQVTKEGLEAYEFYKYAQANMRKINTGLSDRVRDMLHLHKIQEARRKKLA